MTNHDKKYIIFIAIVIIVITAASLSIIYVNKPSTVPAIRTIMSSGATIASSIESEETTIVSPIDETSSVVTIFPIDLNAAKKNELMQLNGIGDVIAQRIIDYRLAGNHFYSIEDIKNIKGIGNSIYDKIKDNICVDIQDLPPQITQEAVTTTISLTVTTQPTVVTTEATVTIVPEVTTVLQQSSLPKVTEEISSSKTTTAEVSVEFPIDINSATADELMCLNGIGQVIADKIITYRETHGGFYSVEEIMKVSGIGEVTFNKIKSQIYADTSNLAPQTTTIKEEPTTTITAITNIPIINLDTATVEELEMLPKMTSVLAKNIIHFRDTVLGGKFSSIYEVLYVDGITIDIFNSIKNYITV